jgi:hypothetical protein
MNSKMDVRIRARLPYARRYILLVLKNSAVVGKKKRGIRNTKAKSIDVFMFLKRDDVSICAICKCI